MNASRSQAVAAIAPCRSACRANIGGEVPATSFARSGDADTLLEKACAACDGPVPQLGKPELCPLPDDPRCWIEVDVRATLTHHQFRHECSKELTADRGWPTFVLYTSRGRSGEKTPRGHVVRLTSCADAMTPGSPVCGPEPACFNVWAVPTDSPRDVGQENRGNPAP